MSNTNDITTLDNSDDEDIFDVVAKLEHSFDLRFDKNAFYYVKTFGDLCDVFAAHLTQEHQDDCTSQQAFYRVREAIHLTQLVDRKEIRPGSNLDELFPRPNRRQKVKEFGQYLGIKVNILTYPDWLGWVFTVGFLLSLVAFFFTWWIAVSGILICVLAIKIAGALGKEWKLQTVGQLAEKLTRENYSAIRRNKGTMNRGETFRLIADTFHYDLAIGMEYLTKDARFSWA